MIRSNRRDEEVIAVKITSTKIPERMTLDEARAARARFSEEMVRNYVALDAAINRAELVEFRKRTRGAMRADVDNALARIYDRDVAAHDAEASVTA